MRKKVLLDRAMALFSEIEEKTVELKQIFSELNGAVNPDKKILEKLYIGEKKSLSEIAKIYDLTPAGVLYRLNKYKIKRRNPGFGTPPNKYSLPDGLDKNWLAKEYENKSTALIGEELGITHRTVLRLLREFDIPIRPQKKNKSMKPEKDQDGLDGNSDA